MSVPPADYIELNLNNYDEDDVSQLNEWAIWASDEIEDLEDENKRLKKLIDDIHAMADYA